MDSFLTEIFKFIINNLAPIVSLVFSTFAFIFTLRNERAKKFNIDVKIICDGLSCEWEVDRINKENPDVYFQSNFRFFPTATITNNSSLPVTINEISLNKKYIFGIYTKIGKNYSVTVQNGKTKKNGISCFGNEEKVGIDFSEMKPLKPIFTIPPYQSVAGILVFIYNEPLVGKESVISLDTSRGVKDVSVSIEKQLVSQVNGDNDLP